MTKLRPVFTLIPALALLAGCALIPKHSVEVSTSYDLAKVGRVAVLLPFFPEEIKRAIPEDFPEMDPASREATGKAVQAALIGALGASMTIDSSYVPDAQVDGWAKEIGKDLTIGRIPLAVPSTTCPADSVLLTAVNWYGVEKDQYYWQFMWMKKKPFGKPTFDHICDLTSMLVRPSDGKILLTIRHEERSNSRFADSAALAGTLARTAEAVKAAFLRNSR